MVRNVPTNPLNGTRKRTLRARHFRVERRFIFSYCYSCHTGKIVRIRILCRFCSVEIRNTSKEAKRESPTIVGADSRSFSEKSVELLEMGFFPKNFKDDVRTPQKFANFSKEVVIATNRPTN